MSFIVYLVSFIVFHRIYSISLYFRAFIVFDYTLFYFIHSYFIQLLYILLYGSVFPFIVLCFIRF